MNNYVYNDIKKKFFFKKKYYYIIIERNFFIAEEVQNKILNFYDKAYYQVIYINIKMYHDWQKVYYQYHQTNLFNKKKILLLTIENNNINYKIDQIIDKIINFHNKNIILIIKFINTNYYINFFLQKNYHNIIIIHCNEFKKKETIEWIKNKIKKMKFYLNEKSILFLYNQYNNNLLILYKTLEVLSLLSSNTILNIKNIKQIIYNNIPYQIQNWIKSIINKKKKNAIKMVFFFQKNNYPILNLLRVLQKIIIHDIYKNYFYTPHNSEYHLKNKFQYQNHKKIYQVINIMYKIEKNIKNNKNQLNWMYLQTIITII